MGRQNGARVDGEKGDSVKPYYEHGGITIYCGDCREVLAGIHGDSVITDPPYGINYNPGGGDGIAKRGRYERVIGDDKPFDPTPFLAYSTVVLWGANHYADRLPASPGWLCWVKIGDGGPRDCSDLELAWTNRNMPARRFSHLWRGMIRASERNEQRSHATQKPVVLMQWCIEVVGATGTVLDPFMGSGTTGVACVELNRRFVGIELEERYCEIAAKRIEAALMQPKLFETERQVPIHQLELAEV